MAKATTRRAKGKAIAGRTLDAADAGLSPRQLAAMEVLRAGLRVRRHFLKRRAGDPSAEQLDAITVTLNTVADFLAEGDDLSRKGRVRFIELVRAMAPSRDDAIAQCVDIVTRAATGMPPFDNKEISDDTLASVGADWPIYRLAVIDSRFEAWSGRTADWCALLGAYTPAKRPGRKTAQAILAALAEPVDAFDFKGRPHARVTDAIGKALERAERDRLELERRQDAELAGLRGERMARSIGTSLLQASRASRKGPPARPQ